MAQITWRNIDAPDLTGASNMLKQAQLSFNSVGQGLQSLIADRNANDAANVDLLRKNNEEAIKDLYASYKTPEELMAAQQSGALAQKIASFGGAYDKAAVRDLDAQRMAMLRDQVMKGQEYDNSQRDQTESSVWDTIYEKAQKKDRTGVDQLLAQNNLRLEGQRAKDVYAILNGYDRFALDQNRDKRDASRLGLESARFKLAKDAQDRALQHENDLRDFGNEALRVQEVQRSNAEKVNAVFNSAYQAVGLQPNAKGEYDDSKLTAEQKAAVKKLTQGVTMPTDTEVLNNFKQFATNTDKYKTLTAQERLGGVSVADSSLSQRTGLAATDTASQAAYKKSIEDGMVDNPYWKGKDDNPLESAKAVIDKYSGKLEDGSPGLFGESNKDVRKKYTDQAIDAMTNGVEIVGDDGKTTKVKVPSQIVDMYMGTVLGGFGEFNGDLTEGLSNWLMSGAPTVQELQSDAVQQLKVSQNKTGGPLDALSNISDLNQLNPTMVNKRKFNDSQVGKWLSDFNNAKKELRDLSAKSQSQYNSNPVSRAENNLKRVRNY